MKKALITGITGQDGSYLAHLLLQKGYEVHGIKRRSSSLNTQRIDHLYQDPHDANYRFCLHYGDLSDTGSLMQIVRQVQPDEVYNLGAMSHVKVSFDIPEYTGNINGLGVVRLLDAVRHAGLAAHTRFYQASTSEMYGTAPAPQNELTPFAPCSPYAAAKLYAHSMVRIYRHSYNMFALSGILFNHESPVRGETFVTRKITRGIAQMSVGRQNCLYLGNLDAIRDWGHAEDYAEAMWLMLQQEQPLDLVIATGNYMQVRDFLKTCFVEIGVEIAFVGTGDEECAVVCSCRDTKLAFVEGQVVVRIDPRYKRPFEVPCLRGDAQKAQEVLKWQAKRSTEYLIKEMMLYDMQLVALK